jgi:exosortase
MLALLMLPIPTAFIDPIILKLRLISSIGSEKIVELLGIPVIREDMTLFVNDAAVAIADACSGFSTLYACLTFALLFAHMTSSPAKKLILVLAAAPIAIASNILRCAGLVVLVNSYGSEILETPLHIGSGFVSFLAALGALALLSRWEAPERRTES